MDKIKVCFVSTFAYGLYNTNCNKTFGGSEVQVYLLAKELAKDENFEVSVVVGDFGQAEKEVYDGVNVIKSFSTEKNKSNYIKAPFKLYHVLKKINPDIVVQRSAAPETGISAFYCKQNNKKFVYSIAHDMDVNGEFVKKGIFGKIYNYGLENTDYIIAQNYDQKTLLENWKKKRIENIEIIKSGYEISDVNIEEKNFILWVGRSDKWKRPEFFLDLAVNFPDEKFVMIMPKSSQKQYWQEIKERADSIKNLEFIEKVGFFEIDNYFQKAKIFVNTSEYEGFPNTFIQATKNKTPIISLNVNPENFIEKNNLGFYCEDSFENMLESLDYLLNNQDKYYEMAENSFDYARNNHDIKNIIEFWKVVFKSIISENGR